MSIWVCPKIADETPILYMKMNKLENDVLNHQRRVFSRVFETNPSEWSLIASLWTGDLFPTFYLILLMTF